MTRFQTYPTAALFSLIALSACETPVGLSSKEEELVEIYNNQKMSTLLLDESFEREFVVSPDSTQAASFGWRGFIWDYGTPVIGTSNSSRNVAATIMDNSILGEAADGDRALYLYGRDGYSTHSIYLFTHAYDLSDFRTVEIEFDYLTFMLNDAEDTAAEYLRVDICHDTSDVCGVGTTIDNNKLKGNSWMTVFNSDSKEFSAALNGKNHLKSDWKRAKIRLDIGEFENRSNFIFRINAFMSDGFASNDLNKQVEDMAAIDNIKVNAVKWVDPSTGEEVDGPSDPDDYSNEFDELYNL